MAAIPSRKPVRAFQPRPLRQETSRSFRAAPFGFSVSNQTASHNKSGRNDFTAELIRHAAVHSYGKHLRHCRLPEPDLGRQTKLQTIAGYHFCLAFENSVAPDYVTEKIYDCFMAGVVPVYLGAPNVAEFAPKDSYISADAHGGPRSLATYLNYLLERPDEYGKYLAWRDKPLPQGLAAMMEATAIHPFIRLLELAMVKKNQSSATG